MNSFFERQSRRAFLDRTAGGLGALALAQLLGPARALGSNPPKAGHYRPRAKAVISLFQHGGPSQMDLFDGKPALNSELQDVSYLFFDRIFKQGLGVKQILTTTTGYVGANTAPLYGMSAPASGYVERDLGVQRVGYFSQLPFLTLYAHNDEPSSILRGVSMNLDVLCAQLGPPAAVIPPIPPLMAGQTNRQRIDTLTAGCGQSCHNEMINPLGFAFEHFDGMGQWRDTENGGLTIDSSGSYSFADGTSKTWTGAADLMQALADSPQAHTCYAKKLASFALQRDVVVSDMPMLTALTSSSMASTGSIKQLVIDLVRNNAFRTHVGGTP